MSSAARSARVLPRSFFERDTVTVARDLLGKVLESTVAGERVSGRIVETEAYLGSHDPGSHAATRGITARNAVMYGPGAHAYVYFTYGNHHMLNLIAEAPGTAGGVLVRAVEPLEGIDIMTRRRAQSSTAHRSLASRELTNGPGKVASAFGVDLTLNGVPLDGSRGLAVYDAPVPPEAVAASGRIGLSAGHELDLRFFLEGNQYVSHGRTGPRQPSRRSPTTKGDAR
jgi:DNA-3-methyladenine glycosylase